jgi:hypothetical protein
VLEEEVKVRDIKIKKTMTYVEEPVYVLDGKDRVTRNRLVKLYKIMWSNHSERDATWEWKIICEKFTLPFIKNGMLSKSWDEIFIRGEGCNTHGVCLASFHHHEHS